MNIIERYPFYQDYWQLSVHKKAKTQTNEEKNYTKKEGRSRVKETTICKIVWPRYTPRYNLAELLNLQLKIWVVVRLAVSWDARPTGRLSHKAAQCRLVLSYYWGKKRTNIWPRHSHLAAGKEAKEISRGLS